MRLPVHGEYDISIVLCGEAGQGIQTVEKLLVNVLKKEGFDIFSFKEYMSRIRGGSNSTTIRVSDRPVRAYSERIDILIPISPSALTHLSSRISTETIILMDNEMTGSSHHEKGKVVPVEIVRSSREAGGKVLSNVVAAGIVLSMLGVDKDKVGRYVREAFSKKSQDVIDKNLKALDMGYGRGSSIISDLGIEVGIEPDSGKVNDLLLDGSEAVSLGCLAGGCNFISSYPMSPSTGVLTFLSNKQREFSLISEQAEDEISAINMAIGAWYAGARAMVTTSGGGFDLMAEGLSLTGAIESPMVIHLSQRPGPATGLPTRTEQGDLMLALHSGHGEFPRAIFSPGDLEEAFSLSAKAFWVADRCQVPVFVMTDQYLIDTYYNLREMPQIEPVMSKHLVETNEDYRRYADSPDGISPRGIPAYGKGLVHADSDEHDDEGHITESMTVRTSMVQKRMRKLQVLRKEAEAPLLWGPEDYRYLVVGWGSTKHVIRESIERLERDDVAALHILQAYPLHPCIRDFIGRSKEYFIVENNATSQLGRLMMEELNTDPGHQILQFDGLPFSVEGLCERLRSELRSIKEVV